MPDAATEKIIHWVLSKPVLMWRLKRIALEGLDGGQELIYMVADLLDPARSPMRREILHATGARPVDADAVWHSLGGSCDWVDHVDWLRVRRVLLEQHTPELWVTE